MSSKRIIVIGAGLAGLAAAKTLQAQGHEVLVLEARTASVGVFGQALKYLDMPLDLARRGFMGLKVIP